MPAQEISHKAGGNQGKMKDDELEKIVKFYPANDSRKPDKQENRGIGDLQVCISMSLKGKKGVVNFIFNTGIYLRQNISKTHNAPREGEVDIGYHSYTPVYKWQTPHENCNFLNGETCYHESSNVDAYKYLDILLHNRDNTVWELLEEYYHKIFYEQKNSEIWTT